MDEKQIIPLCYDGLEKKYPCVTMLRKMNIAGVSYVARDSTCTVIASRLKGVTLSSIIRFNGLYNEDISLSPEVNISTNVPDYWKFLHFQYPLLEREKLTSLHNVHEVIGNVSKNFLHSIASCNVFTTPDLTM
jgi:hypothetical protein